ncbi:NAD(P)-dependent oxidoreductase [Lactobacillus sp. ESL0233]|uniref:NAD(P)-dependent oxidoreductase n=1 Tax=Lactobacillus sp. ESL0233 TaxID=2069354 RepID=UPI000EFD33DD|nr:NAD(P)-dependent oxidoreductase [Lactobacillus sp. ESL0233]RMC43150.1 NAD(P)-dependent oxidoreductase [Lactobacillus sp. ESL0233]
MKIGFIGTGVMGNAICLNLLKAGHQLFVYNRSKSKTDNLVEQGAVWCSSARVVTKKADLIFTMLGFPTDVEEVYFGSNGIFEEIVQGKYIVDLTTSKPRLAQKIFTTGVKNGAKILDAPVSGGDLGAKNGTLTIMVGGDKDAFRALQPVFNDFGKAVHYFGPAGSGQNTKMANQIMIAGTMTGMTEMFVYAKEAGLDLATVLETVSGGSAANWSLSNYGPRILQGDYTPGFFSKHFLKDLRIALETATEMNLSLPATTEAKRLYEVLVDKQHLGDLGTQSLIKLWWQ